MRPLISFSNPYVLIKSRLFKLYIGAARFAGFALFIYIFNLFVPVRHWVWKASVPMVGMLYFSPQCNFYLIFSFAQQNYINVVVVCCLLSVTFHFHKKSECDVTNPAVIIVIRDLYMDYYCNYSGMAKLPQLCGFILSYQCYLLSNQMNVIMAYLILSTQAMM